jgi:rod shape determining protein RodA
MWDHRYLRRIDFRSLFLVLFLMIISLLVISTATRKEGEEAIWTALTLSQIRWFGLGWLVYFFFTGLDYRKILSWSFFLYFLTILLLIGLFFVPAVRNVHRWYRLPVLGISIQPSEFAKLVVVFALSTFLEKRSGRLTQMSNCLIALAISFIPFLLILKQPDLGTALVLYPITLVIFYFSGVNKKLIFTLSFLGLLAFIAILMIFLEFLSYEEMRPYATKILKEYQYERLNPHTYHQKAAQTALALGGVKGSGWRQSEFTGNQWLPFAHTDSVFATFGEEFGLCGVFLLLLFFFGLIYFSFQVTAVAKDHFGRLLSAGTAAYLAMHVIVNMGMMCGFLPITGIPLILISYGGASVLSTMAALGILQSIYSRRFMF